MSQPRKRNLPPPPPPRDDEARAMRQSVRYVEAQGPDDPVPDDMVVFRLALARRIETLLGTPGRCGAPVCRRRKVCADPAMRCRRNAVMPAMTQEEQANAMADVQRMVKQELARRDAAEAASQPAPSRAMIEAAGRKRG